MDPLAEMEHIRADNEESTVKGAIGVKWQCLI